LIADSTAIIAPEFIVENETISMSCTMNYYSGGNVDTQVPLANLTWSGDGCTPGVQNIISNSTYAASPVFITAQSPLPTCICTQRFNAPTNPQPGYATNAPTYTNTSSSPSFISFACALVFSLAELFIFILISVSLFVLKLLSFFRTSQIGNQGVFSFCHNVDAAERTQLMSVKRKSNIK
jgi:hypothetical protein